MLYFVKLCKKRKRPRTRAAFLGRDGPWPIRNCVRCIRDPPACELGDLALQADSREAEGEEGNRRGLRNRILAARLREGCSRERAG